jgi:hypothetical protein
VETEPRENKGRRIGKKNNKDKRDVNLKRNIGQRKHEEMKKE